MSGSSVAYTQGGYTNPYTGNTWNNPISSYLDTVILHGYQRQQLMNQQFSNMLFNQMMMDSMLKKVGNERIAAGKASTRFTPSERGSQVEAMVPEGGDAAARKNAIAANRACLADFHAAMKRFGLTPYDVADARALSLVMAYTAYKGQDPGPARLKNVRSQFRQAMLKDPMFQAIPDYERQARYEKMVIPAMLAVTARRQSTKPGMDTEQRDVLVAMAERMGEGLLKGLWTKPTQAIELSPTGFVDRGDRVVATGGGKTTFQRLSKSLMVPVYGNNYTNQSFGWNEAYYQKLLDRFDASMNEWGLRTNDIADANVGAAVMAYLVYTDGKVTLNANQRAWLRKEMRKDVLSSPDFQRMTDAQMQEVYEKIALEAAHQVTRREAMLKEIADLSKDNGDSFSRIGNAGVIQADKRILETNRSGAHDLLKRIFAPRNFDAYSLTLDGFRSR
jgi:hypothetical protein